MKLRLLFFAGILAFIGHTSLAEPKTGSVTFGGGDGSTVEKAIIIKGANEESGVHAEYDYLAKHYQGYKRGAQSLQKHNGRIFDVLEFTTADGTKKTIYFDITDFFGKN